MTVWNYGILLRGIAQKDPNRLAQVFGDTRYTWGEFHSRSNALAADMLRDGRPYLLGTEPCIADFAAYHVVWFYRGRKIDGTPPKNAVGAD